MIDPGSTLTPGRATAEAPETEAPTKGKSEEQLASKRKTDDKLSSKKAEPEEDTLGMRLGKAAGAFLGSLGK